MAQIIDGKALANRIREEIKAETERMEAKHGIVPGLAVILVGNDPASEVYVRNKKNDCEKVGFYSEVIHLPEETSADTILEHIRKLNNTETIDGILVQMPLPGHLESASILNAIRPHKDVDGLHPVNLGRLLSGQPCMEPCTPKGVMRMLDSIGYEVEGKRAVVVGRSVLVGKPIAMMLMARNATVTMCHSRTRNLPEVCAEADILIAATGRAEMIDETYVKDGAVVIDVGISRMGKKLTGDVAFDRVAEKAGWITPVPGGVGPMTRAMLLVNTLQAAKLRVQ
jgi:methylenetetrahydrofolate dehydrogenase (NADP+)/methenyltetrahydrofolate cyclohydrolase